MIKAIDEDRISSCPTFINFTRKSTRMTKEKDRETKPSSADKKEKVQKETEAKDLSKPATQLPPDQSSKIQQLLQQLSLGDLAKLQQQFAPSTKTPKSTDDYKFWKTQPVPRLDENVSENGPIEADKASSEIQQEPYKLPNDFKWEEINLESDLELKDVYELLSLNYVEDDDCTFRFDYSADFLKWALQPPGWKKSWIIGVRVVSTKKLVAFISAIPATLHIHDKPQKLVEINFLCVHKKLRSKRLAPVMIKEITRRVHLEGLFQALYTAGAYLPKPFSTCRYYHRSLNPKKLVETGFSALGRNMTMARMIKNFKLPETPLTEGLREMTDKDVTRVTELANAYLQTFKVAPRLSEDEVKHWMLPIPNVVYSFVVENPKTHEITDFFSFYNLPSSVIGHPVHKTLKAAYLFYYGSKNTSPSASDLQDLIRDALILAKKNEFDVFNCLNLMDNTKFIDELKFGKGDGLLHYYFYNYRCKEIKPEETGIVLL